MTTYKIYTLTDPRNNKVFYVGATRLSERARLYGHAASGKGIRYELARLRILPILEVLETTPCIDTARLLEEYWYFQFKSWGYVLENSYKGQFFKYQEKPTIYIKDYLTKKEHRLLKKAIFRHGNLKKFSLQTGLDPQTIKRLSYRGYSQVNIIEKVRKVLTPKAA